jgi:hypothetical protein
MEAMVANTSLSTPIYNVIVLPHSFTEEIAAECI